MSDPVSPAPSPVAPADAEQPRAAPRSPAELFWAFNRLALQGFGGVLPIAQRELVERCGWMTRTQFVELLSIGQVLPGPNIINVALMFGDRFFGWRGALAACSGMLLLPLLIVLAATVFYQQVAHLPVFAGALRGMGAVAAGLVIATGAKLVVTLKRHPLGRGVALCYAGLAALLVGGLRWPMVGVVLGLGTLTMLHVAWVLRQRAPQ
ncbi:MAG TPA: chromate transporter [Burkholderiaceae bacterium]|nr:chromate transporter [Burkholderiaceae bacterium]HMX10828.1 chromate transporter [Burkholderiaceae bacterium]HMZ00009.1 chromate transporter [Burkholderiaceae bacterium]HNB43837.1 chromate transporter [Burkholderiaceae bacterium]HNG79902.1 chromate transporter [Burkholderiaceae bacterium]